MSSFQFGLVQFSAVWFTLLQPQQQQQQQREAGQYPFLCSLRLSSTASRSCPSHLSTPGSCHHTGRLHWSRDCCGHRKHGWEPGKKQKQHCFSILSRISCLTSPWAASHPELWAGVWEEVDLPKVVSGNQEALIVGSAHGVDVGAVWAVGPQAWGSRGRRKCLLNAQLNTNIHVKREIKGSATYQRPGSPECRCGWPTQYLWLSPRWPPVYTLMGSLRKQIQSKYKTGLGVA